MGGRVITQYNTEPPLCVTRMAADPPACFDRELWAWYLVDVWRAALDDKKLRNALTRGETPDYCADCTWRYRSQMTAVGRCHPPAGADTPQEVQHAA